MQVPTQGRGRFLMLQGKKSRFRSVPGSCSRRFRSVPVLDLAKIAHGQVSQPTLIQQKVDCHRKTGDYCFFKEYKRGLSLHIMQVQSP